MLDMQTDRSAITLSELVHRAATIVDPDGFDAAVQEFLVRYEDADEPVRGILDGLDERIAFGVDEDEAVIMAQALVLYLAHRIDQVDHDGLALLRLAARSEFDGHPPAPVVDWLVDVGADPR
jgi:hypothetical protein